MMEPGLLDVKLPAELVQALSAAARKMAGAAESVSGEIVREVWWQGAVVGLAVGVVAGLWLRRE